MAKYGPQEKVSLTQEDIDRVSALSDELMVSRSAVLRMLVHEALEFRATTKEGELALAARLWNRGDDSNSRT